MNLNLFREMPLILFSFREMVFSFVGKRRHAFQVFKS